MNPRMQRAAAVCEAGGGEEDEEEDAETEGALGAQGAMRNRKCGW